MSKWVSYGFSPGNDPEVQGTREIENELLCEYLPIILANSERILETPHYFFCQFGSAYLSTPYVYRGGGLIPLGVLILLWQAGEMLYECPTCAGHLYAMGIGGSILSGSGSVWGVCDGCWQTRGRRRERCDGRDMTAVGELLQLYRNEPVIEKGEQPHFDWAEGLKGESTPDKVIIPAVEPADFWTLIRELTGAAHGELGANRSASAQAEHKEEAFEISRARGLTFPILLGKKRG